MGSLENKAPIGHHLVQFQTCNSVQNHGNKSIYYPYELFETKAKNRLNRSGEHYHLLLVTRYLVLQRGVSPGLRI
jgi:hypothetical protein